MDSQTDTKKNGKNRTFLALIAGMVLLVLGLKLFIEPNATLQVAFYEVEIPKGFLVKTTTPGLVVEENTTLGIVTSRKIVANYELEIEKDGKIVGGIEILSYEPGQPLFFPNHSEIKEEKELNNLLTKAVFVNMDLTPPAASGETQVRNENHLYLTFDDLGLVYDIYGDSAFLSESDLVDIAKSFKKGEDFEVRKLLDDFGKVLIHVDKTAPDDLKKEMIKEYYGPYVSNDLLEKWLEEPSTVPGRYVSSPWPDRIEIKNVTRLDKDRFLVDADVVEVVSGTGRLEDVWRAPVSITVEYISGKWLITSFESL